MFSLEDGKLTSLETHGGLSKRIWNTRSEWQRRTNFDGAAVDRDRHERRHVPGGLQAQVLEKEQHYAGGYERLSKTNA